MKILNKSKNTYFLKGGRLGVNEIIETTAEEYNKIKSLGSFIIIDDKEDEEDKEDKEDKKPEGNGEVKKINWAEKKALQRAKAKERAKFEAVAENEAETKTEETAEPINEE
jgi:hypothetical protein